MKKDQPSPRRHRQIAQSVSELLGSVTHLIDSLRATVAATKGGKPDGRGGYRVLSPEAAERRSARLKKSIKASWDRMAPAERAERVRRMLAGRGLKPKKDAAKA
jgi:hypothetical protein